MVGKRSWLAVLISAIQPGLGTAYAGDRTRGLKIWAAFWALLASAVALGGWERAEAYAAELMCAFTLIFLYPWSLIDAKRTASGPPSPPSPWWAALLSLILPGLGQAYVGRDGRAWKIWGSVSVVWVLFEVSYGFELPEVVSDVATILVLPTGLAPILSAYDAYRLARREVRDRMGGGGPATRAAQGGQR